MGRWEEREGNGGLGEWIGRWSGRRPRGGRVSEVAPYCWVQPGYKVEGEGVGWVGGRLHGG